MTNFEFAISLSTMRKLFIFLLLCSVPTFVMAGDNIRWVGSAGIGFRSNASTAGIGAGISYKEHILFEINAGGHFVYGGTGVGCGLRYNIYLGDRLFLSPQFYYRYLLKDDISVGYNNDSSVVTYRIPSMNALLPQLGIGWNFQRAKDGPFESIALNFSYQLPLNAARAQYKSGLPSENIERKINNRYSEGIGFSVIYTVYF